VVSGLVNQTEYRFTVRAHNSAGWSAYSAASALVVPQAPPVPPAPSDPAAPAVAPSAPVPAPSVSTPPLPAVDTAPTTVTGLAVAFPKKKTATFSWTVPNGASEYQVRISKKNSKSKYRAWTAVTAPSATFTKLVKGGKYRVQVIAVNAAGTSPKVTYKFTQK
jgi:hypothetical protein